MFIEKLLGYHFHHLRIVEIIDDVLEDVPVSNKAQSSEDDHHRDLLLHVRQDGDYALPYSRFFCTLKNIYIVLLLLL